MNPIITAHQEIVIENSVRYIELLKSEATKILDEYWETWKARNQLISQTTYANGGKFMPGRFAPVFKKVGSSQKLTIVWKDFSPRFKNKIEHHGVVVKPKLGGYSVSCFKNALDWELEMILETENKIKPIRELLAEYHQTKTGRHQKTGKTEEVNIMADNASPKTEPRNQRNAGNNRPLGMVISKLKPLSSEFYTHFHEKNRACLRQFNAISNAIYNIFRLVEGDQATSTKVQKWLSGVYDELSGNVNTFKEQIDKNVARLPLDDSSFEGFDYGEFEIRWNHPMTYKLLDIIQTINVLTRQAHQLWLYGQISQQVHDRIILQLLSSLRVAMDNITKILNAENRVNGKYDALPFIQSIKRFKSVELYIASLETKAPVQSGHSNSSADAGSEPTLKPEEAAGSGKLSDKTQPSATPVSVQ
ncbi:conjugative transfer protein MobI(A/C) [Klebsiella pneumoniae]